MKVIVISDPTALASFEKLKKLYLYSLKRIAKKSRSDEDDTQDASAAELLLMSMGRLLLTSGQYENPRKT